MDAHKVIPLTKPIKYSIAVPGSKSFMNRALLCAALAKGKTRLEHPVYCDDTNYMIKALTQLGVRFVKSSGSIAVYGVDGKFKTPERSLYLGNAGTATRFLTPVVPAGTIITGDSHMQQRPLIDLLKAMSALGFVTTTETGCPPVTVLERNQKTSIVNIKGNMSSQYISALLMLAPTLDRPLRIRLSGKLVSKPYVEMTLQVMKQFGINIINNNFKDFIITPQAYKACRYEIEGDASSATYWWALAAITGSAITVSNIASDTLQPDKGMLHVLDKMGCQIEGHTVTGPQLETCGISVDMGHMPDAVMSVAMVAARSAGVTTLRNIEHLTIKETDRIKVLVENLKKLGVRASATRHSITIQGKPKKFKASTIKTHDDHRFALAFTIFGLSFPGIKIDQPGCVNKSYPTFWRDVRVVQQQSKTQTIMLTGMRGSGKSTLARKLAKQYGSRYVDIDDEIVKKIKMPLNNYVERYGWPAFRNMEYQVTKLHAHDKNTIIASGGGTLMYEQNYDIVKHYYIIFLYAPLSTLKQRVAQDMNKRPALLHSTVNELGEIWCKRESKYFLVADQVYDSRYTC